MKFNKELYDLYKKLSILLDQNNFIIGLDNFSRRNPKTNEPEIYLPDWFPLYDGRYHTPSSINFLIKRLKMENSLINNQVIYDILVLGLSSPDDRPKCKCGNYLPFVGIFQNGYRHYCSRACADKYKPVPENFKIQNIGGKLHKGKKRSEETRRKISESNKGKVKYIITQETKDKLSKILKGRKITWKDKQREAALRRIDRDPNCVINLVKSRGKSGYYKAEKADKTIRYLSTWELHFMKLCDLSKDVISIDSVDPIPYTIAGKDHRYIPDFKVVLNSTDNKQIIVIVEIKPKNLVNDPVVIAKRIAAIKYFRKIGYKYITLTEVELYKRINGSFNLFDYIV